MFAGQTATESHLANLYNDQAPLEHHHLAVTFQILRRKGCDILEHLDKPTRVRWGGFVRAMPSPLCPRALLSVNGFIVAWDGEDFWVFHYMSTLGNVCMIDESIFYEWKYTICDGAEVHEIKMIIALFGGTSNQESRCGVLNEVLRTSNVSVLGRIMSNDCLLGMLRPNLLVGFSLLPYFHRLDRILLFSAGSDSACDDPEHSCHGDVGARDAHQEGKANVSLSLVEYEMLKIRLFA